MEYRLFDFREYNTETLQKEQSLIKQQNHFNREDDEPNNNEIDDDIDDIDDDEEGEEGEDQQFESFEEKLAYMAAIKNSYTKSNNNYVIQAFGINEKGESCCIYVHNFQPFFYAKINCLGSKEWTDEQTKNMLKIWSANPAIGKKTVNDIVSHTIVSAKKLYGFDNGAMYDFLYLKFRNTISMNRVKNVFYETTNHNGNYNRRLHKGGYKPFTGGKYYSLELYEAHVPPLLRFFHVQEISPSGWIQLPLNKRLKEIPKHLKTTSCSREFEINYKYIVPLPTKETRVPYKICSFDIEASSSHGDFPLPIKNYKKLAMNIVDVLSKMIKPPTEPQLTDTIIPLFLQAAFGFNNTVEGIELVYPKIPVSSKELDSLISYFLKYQFDIDTSNIVSACKTQFDIYDLLTGGNADDNDNDHDHDHDYDPADDNSDDDSMNDKKGYDKKGYDKKKGSKNKLLRVIDICLPSDTLNRDHKINILTEMLDTVFPPLEGDKVTFIGSTFLRYGDSMPYMNHCIALNTCDPVNGAIIESYSTEKDVLLAWRNLILREDPDIIIGYNIFGFDYKFMFDRAKENHIVHDFLQLSRIQKEICANLKRDPDSGTMEYKIEESSISIASGQYELYFIKMVGRLQIDLLNYFRREFNLSSYKLDYVSGQFICDNVKSMTPSYNASTGSPVTEIQSKNLTGLLVDGYIHFEESSHSTDYYKDGAKFHVTHVDYSTGKFEIAGHEIIDMTSKSVKWGLAKDDVTPQDIFRMTNEGPNSRAVIAKYCIQDCNLVHHLMRKIDVITGLVEMASICSVPMNFLVMRGQGIKLTSLVAKECRKQNTLLPTLDKTENDGGYEGAIVLQPKCGIYLDNPVAVGDFASLYPSSMLSENISHDSKVWTKEYDLDGNLIKLWPEIDYDKYDNLPDITYVNICYDTYKWTRPHPTAAAVKVKCGSKICRFAQGKRALMPSILQNLLAARKATRKLAEKEKDEFIANILDKRQLSYKLCANSLYGQTGARTSSFYEKDVAASTTATGRLMLTFAEKIIINAYKNRICQTENYGPVLTNTERIYGDSVTNYTPVYIRHAGKLDILTIEELAEKYGDNKWIKCKEEGKQEKEFCELAGIESWSEKGWTKLYRVIRHQLAPHKKIIRIMTPQASIDVTDDHSLLLKHGAIEVSPKNVVIGTELLHHSLHTEENKELIEDFIQRNRTSMHAANRVNTLLHLNQKKLGEQIIDIREIAYEGYVYDLTTENHHFAAGIGNMIVHNTDSVFFTFNLQTPEGEPLRGKKALEITIELAQQACHLAGARLKAPQDLEYEKTFMPFILLSKKRYVGMLYEFDPNKCKQKSMGIVLKRRDNANIVKDVYGGIIDIFMKGQTLDCACDFLKTQLQYLVDGKIGLDKLVITKSLRSDYKKPEQIAHKVLADRIGKRDPGNKPSPGDRIPYVYIVTDKPTKLQGDKIEIPSYIIDHHLPIDYTYYITNQLMKPLLQVFGLVVNDLPGMTVSERIVLAKNIANIKYEMQELNKPPEKIEDKINDTKERVVKRLLFDPFLHIALNKKHKQNTLVESWKTSTTPSSSSPSSSSSKNHSIEYKPPVRKQATIQFRPK